MKPRLSPSKAQQGLYKNLSQNFLEDVPKSSAAARLWQEGKPLIDTPKEPEMPTPNKCKT